MAHYGHDPPFGLQVELPLERRLHLGCSHSVSPLSVFPKYSKKGGLETAPLLGVASGHKTKGFILSNPAAASSLKLPAAAEICDHTPSKLIGSGWTGFVAAQEQAPQLRQASV
ncbi:hypothetical protein [Thauera mechernichensis]